MFEDIIHSIIKEELTMFLAVKSRGYSVCQENPHAFWIARKMTHSVQSEDFLQSYYLDLIEAKNAGRNIMTEKYALMEALIPRTNFDEHLDKIIAIESEWYDISTQKYPHITPPEGKDNFKVYLSCELQTISPRSLKLYYHNILNAYNRNINLVIERYKTLLSMNNLSSIDEYEKKLAEKKYQIKNFS